MFSYQPTTTAPKRATKALQIMNEVLSVTEVLGLEVKLDLIV